MEIFNVAENEATLEEIMELVHPDDVERVLAALESRLDPVIRTARRPSSGSGGDAARFVGWRV
jgi:hypothetical protein